ncbi:MAG: hypothetical protein O3C43_14920 [Verrucomicrobia bacterium]|nr:hypothetical protein [Verrucomicrobiota bacterium]MDA1067783.1 hypothetical protein [Verrucomicrobiota bacterium]
MKHTSLPTTLAASALGIFTFCFMSCEALKSELGKWIDQVDAHLSQNEGGQLMAEAIEAHGGLKHWLKNEVLEFRWIYHMNDRGPDVKTNTLQRVDTSSFKAVHEMPDSDIRFGWTGTEAWLHPADAPAQRLNPRFWALTPYYFIGIPFVFADINANYEKLPDNFEFEGTTYQQVKVTFNPGTGDAPDDYYIVLINPETKMVGGARYIVTSPIVARNGPGPEKLITLEAFTKLGGVSLPTKHRSFTMNGNTLGEHIRDADALEYKWLKRAEVDFEAPEDSTRM